MNQRIGIIYGLIEKDTNNIRYIGQTAQPLDKRFNAHLSRSSKLKSPLGDWLSKNIDNVRIEVMEYCLLDNLNIQEIEWIDKFANLVNSMKGKGGSNYTHSEETKRIIAKNSSITHKGRIKSEEHKRKIAETLRKRFLIKENHPMYGKKLKEKHVQEIIENNSKPILQFSLEGEFIKEYSSITNAAAIMNTSITNISRCCRDIVKTSRGYIWKFKQIVLN